jgi:hypothetical protein
MRISALVRHLLLFLAFTSPALLLAQFQQPTPEELKMTADPKAPGAAAVYLNVEEITDDPHNSQSFYARIKVLTEKGKELATVDVPPYLRGTSKITDIRGRTIHSDGTVIPFVGKPQDLLVVKGKSNESEQIRVNRKVFTLPSVEVGSILEYTYTIQNDDNICSSPHWEIQRPYFVHKAHYLFTPARQFLPGTQHQSNMYIEDEHKRIINTLIWWTHLPEGESVKSDIAHHFSVDVEDVPPAPNEEWMPPIESVLYKVFFYYKAASSASEFWMKDATLWSKDVDRFAEPSKYIKEAVAGIISPSDSDLEKAKKLYKAVQALDNTDYSRRKTESEMKQLKLKAARHAENAWKQKSGTSEDIALLYLAMLRAAGLTAYATKVVDRQRGVFDPSYLSLSQLDSNLVILSTGGKEIYLDPGEKMCPFQTLNWTHSDTSGLRQPVDKPGTESSPLQNYIDNKTTRYGDVVLDAQGALTGSFRFSMTGQTALYWRQQAIMNDEAEVKKLFDESLESIIPNGVEAHIDHFNGLDDPNVDLIAIINAKGAIGAATSKRIILPAFFFETRGVHPFIAQVKRTLPVDMHYGDFVADQVTYHLPDGFTVEGAPRDSKISWSDHADLVTKTVSAPGQITIDHVLSRAFTAAWAFQYDDLRSFYQQVAAADQAQLVLARTPSASAPVFAPPAPKGN